MRRVSDLTGERFGRLVVVKRVENIDKGSRWLCKCDCGIEKVIRRVHLANGNTKSCGCLSKEISSVRGYKSKIGERSRKHGDFGTKLYGVWAGMKRRCDNSNSIPYRDYGGRGIKVCEEWKDYSSFKEWAIRAGYEEGLSIERKDVNSDYCPENCMWIPLNQQNRNKRLSIRIEYRGELYTIKQLSELTGLKESTLRARYYKGLAVEEIISLNVRKNQYK
ncbi:hypothetical protein [Cytobacillus gottheilii]|uniref:Uncharacterized protein n=1 Tax=Cytobacillus gottheilii TaxID=859144 RepID=A0ABX8F9B6_9BACI|nr:hypothetical protein [Cytobacillus gottheilii]QVY60931.1 hypothetical protein J1899_18460 [Cytobacillus gottheilii]